MMTIATTVFISTTVFCFWYIKRRIGFGLSLTCILLSILIFVHGAPMLVYLYFTGPDTLIFEAALKSVDRDAVQANVLWAVSLLFIFAPAGSELATIVFQRTYNRGQRNIREQGLAPTLRSYQLSGLQLNAVWAVAFGMAAVSIIESQPSKIFAYFLSGGSEIEKLLLRREEGGTQFYLYNVVLYSVAPFLVMVTKQNYFGKQAATNINTLAVVIFSLVLLGKFATLSKAPPVIFLLQLLLLRMALKRQKLNLAAIVSLGSAALILFSVTVNYTISDLDLSDILKFLYYRVFDIPNESLIEYFAAIPATLPHGWGAGIFSFLRSGHSNEWIQTYSAVAEVTRDSLESTSNVLFIGDAWAEFAWPGVISFSVIAGFTVRSIDIYAFRDGHSDEAACLVAGCSFGVFTMLSTALNTAMVTGGLALLPIISMLLVRRRKSRMHFRARKDAPNITSAQ